MDSKKHGSPARFTRLFPLSLVAIASLILPGTLAWADFPGGFLEQPLTAQVRPKLSASQIQGFLPARGKFTFPAPYNTQGVRLTNATDCGGADCLWYVGYSYWRNINNHVGSDTMYVFLGLNRNNGGGGPTLFSYNKVTEEVRNLGPLFDAGSALSWISGEGWYFSGTQPTKIYVNDGPRMLRYDVLSKQFQTVFDVSARFGADKYIWQMHSSDDDRVHSATLRRTGTWEMLGCVVYREDTAQFQYFPKVGDFDECNLDKSGRWLMSLENTTGVYGLDMRIFDLTAASLLASTIDPLASLVDPFSSVVDLVTAGVERLIYDQNGAVGHADMGYGYVVGTDNWNSLANAILTWDFNQNPLSGNRVFYNTDWFTNPAGHISHTNARPGVPIDQQYACGSNAASASSAWANEVICFRLDGSFATLVVAPVMTDMDSAVGGDSYAKMPKGNLDVTGQYFIWTSNTGGNRVDAFIAKVPAQVLGVGTGGGDGSVPDVTLPPIDTTPTTPPTLPADTSPSTSQPGAIAGAGAGAGGCAFSPTADLDPILPLLLCLAAFFAWRSRRVLSISTQPFWLSRFLDSVVVLKTAGIRFLLATPRSPPHPCCNFA
jgi:hypothetical protein